MGKPLKTSGVLCATVSFLIHSAQLTSATLLPDSHIHLLRLSAALPLDFSSLFPLLKILSKLLAGSLRPHLIVSQFSESNVLSVFYVFCLFWVRGWICYLLLHHGLKQKFPCKGFEIVIQDKVCQKDRVWGLIFLNLLFQKPGRGQNYHPSLYRCFLS